MSIDPQQFGEMIGAVKANTKDIKSLSKAFKDHTDDMEEKLDKTMDGIHHLFKEHMLEEERDSQVHGERLQALEEFVQDLQDFKRVVSWVFRNPKLTFFGAVLVSLSGVVLFGYIFPTITQFLYEATNGQIDLTGMLALYLDTAG